MADITDDGASAVALDTAPAVRRATRALQESANPRLARDIVMAALATFGRTADLLWALAEVEFSDGDVAAGHEAMEEALALDQPSPASSLRRLRMLGGSGCWREALSIIRGIPEGMRQDPLVRVEAGNFYRLCRCPAHAVVAFGRPGDLPWQGRIAWLSCWLLSGGPVCFLRNQALAWEAEALHELQEPPAHVEAISVMPGLGPRQALRVRTQLEAYNFRTARIFFRSIAVRRMAFRLLPLAGFPVWLGLLLLASALAINVGPLSLPGYAIVSMVIAMAQFLSGARLWFGSSGRQRVPQATIVTHLAMIMIADTAIAEALSSPPLPGSGWRSAANLGLIAGSLLLTCLYLIATLGEAYGGRLIRRVIREDPLLSATDQLLITLTGLRSSRGYHGMPERRYHASFLEWAARTLSQDLLTRSSARFLGSGDWLARRTAGWAEALRYAQRQVLAPVPGREAKLEAFLAHEIRCLADGDLGALTWREPPPGLSRRATARRRALSAARTVVVAALPLASVLSAHFLWHFSASLFNWGRVMTVSWALLYFLLSIDPTIRDKIGVAKDLADLAQPPRAGT